MRQWGLKANGLTRYQMGQAQNYSAPRDGGEAPPPPRHIKYVLGQHLSLLDELEGKNRELFVEEEKGADDAPSKHKEKFKQTAEMYVLSSLFW